MNGVLCGRWCKKSLWDSVKVVRWFACLGGRVDACGGCGAIVAINTRCIRVVFGEHCEVLYGRLPLRLKKAVCRSYVGQQFCVEVKQCA